MNLPSYATVAAATTAEGPVRDLLRAVQADEATRNSLLAEWLKQTASALQQIIDGADE